MYENDSAAYCTRLLIELLSANDPPPLRRELADRLNCSCYRDLLIKIPEPLGVLLANHHEWLLDQVRARDPVVSEAALKLVVRLADDSAYCSGPVIDSVSLLVLKRAKAMVCASPRWSMWQTIARREDNAYCTEVLTHLLRTNRPPPLRHAFAELLNFLYDQDLMEDLPASLSIRLATHREWLLDQVRAPDPVVREAALNLVARLTDDSAKIQLCCMVLLGELPLRAWLKSLVTSGSVKGSDPDLRTMIFAATRLALADSRLWPDAFTVLCNLEPPPAEMVGELTSLVDRVGSRVADTGENNVWSVISHSYKRWCDLLDTSCRDTLLRWLTFRYTSNQSAVGKFAKAVLEEYISSRTKLPDGHLNVESQSTVRYIDDISRWSSIHPTDISYGGGPPRDDSDFFECPYRGWVAVPPAYIDMPPNPFEFLMWRKSLNGRLQRIYRRATPHSIAGNTEKIQDVSPTDISFAQTTAEIFRGLVKSATSDIVRARSLVGLLQIPVYTRHVRLAEETHISQPLMTAQQKRPILREAMSALRSVPSPVVQSAYEWAHQIAGGWVDTPVFPIAEMPWFDDVATLGTLTVRGPGAGCLRRPELVERLRWVARGLGVSDAEFPIYLIEFLESHVPLPRVYYPTLDRFHGQLWTDDSDNWWHRVFHNFIVDGWRRRRWRVNIEKWIDVPQRATCEKEELNSLGGLVKRLQAGDHTLKGVQFEAAMIYYALTSGKTVPAAHAELTGAAEGEPWTWRFLFPVERRTLALRAFGVRWKQIREITGMSTTQHDYLQKMLKGKRRRKNIIGNRPDTTAQP